MYNLTSAETDLIKREIQRQITANSWDTGKHSLKILIAGTSAVIYATRVTIEGNLLIYDSELNQGSNKTQGNFLRIDLVGGIMASSVAIGRN